MAFDKYMVVRTTLIVVAAAVLFSLITYYNSKQTTVSAEKFFADQPSVNPMVNSVVPTPSTQAVPVAPTGAVNPNDPEGSDEFRPVDFDVKQVPTDCFPKDRLTAEDLLPSDASSKWAQVNPSGQGDVKNVNFLTAGFHVGINTTSGSMKNPNLQLRSEPPNPKGSWPILNSSYTPSDLLRRPLEIGGDC